MISGLGAFYHSVKDKLYDHTIGRYKDRSVKVLSNPSKQHRMSAEDYKKTKLGMRKAAVSSTKARHMESSSVPKKSNSSDSEPEDEQGFDYKSTVNPESAEAEPLLAEDTSDEDEIPSFPTTPDSQTLTRNALISDYQLTKDAFDIEIPEGQPTPLLQKHVLDELRLELTHSVRHIQHQADDEQNNALMEQCNYLRQAITRNDGPAIRGRLERLQLPELEHFLPPLRLIFNSEQPSEEYQPAISLKDQPAKASRISTPVKPKRTEAEKQEVIQKILATTLKSYQNDKINILMGDITKPPWESELKVDAIACPSDGTYSKNHPHRQSLLRAEPDFATEELQDQLSAAEGGQSFAVKARNLSKQGVKHIVLSATPKPTEDEPRKRLFLSYLTTLQQASACGARSIAIPVSGDPESGMSHEEACHIALTAANSFQTHPDMEKKAPKIYFIFPNNKSFREQYRAMRAKLNAMPEAQPSPPKAHSKKTSPENVGIAILGKTLPLSYGLTSQRKIKWVDRETNKLWHSISNGHYPFKRLERLSSDLQKSFIKLSDLAEKNQISQQEYLTAQKLLQQKIEMVESLITRLDKSTPANSDQKKSDREESDKEESEPHED